MERSSVAFGIFIVPGYDIGVTGEGFCFLEGVCMQSDLLW